MLIRNIIANSIKLIQTRSQFFSQGPNKINFESILTDKTDRKKFIAANGDANQDRIIIEKKT